MTILNQIEIMCNPVWLDVLLLICIGLVVASLFLTIYSDGKEFVVYFILHIVSVISLTVALVVCGTGVLKEPTGRYSYECTIDDNVSIVDVYSEYNVVERRGDIWVLEDKEEN